MVRRTPTGQLMADDGQPLTVDPTAPPAGERSGVTFRRKEDATMPKADKDGVYRLGTTHIKVRKGQVIPAGAEAIDAPQERKKGPAPENRAEPAPAETRKKKSDS